MNKKNEYVKLSIINDTRIILLGIASLMFMFCHTYKINYLEIINISWIGNLVHFIRKTSNVGVDIFLFLSGIGLYLSMTKNTLGRYYKNRFIKIIPKYLIILIIYSFFVTDMNGLKIIQTLIGLPFFVDGVRDGWYIAFIMLLYLIFPLIYKMFKKYDVFALFLGLLISILLNILLSYFSYSYYLKIEIGLARVPVFLLGSYFGKKIYENMKISLRTIKYSFVVQIFILLILYLCFDIEFFKIFSRYLYCPLAICAVINISWLYSLFKNKNSWLLKPIKFVGIHSLEMYLIFDKTCNILRDNYLMTSYVYIYLLAFIISLVLSYLLNKSVNFLINKFA